MLRLGRTSQVSESVRNDPWVYPLGGASAIVGAILGLALNLAHPATAGPSHPMQTALVVAHSRIWVPLHLGIVVAFIFMLGGLIAIHDSINDGVSSEAPRGLSAALVRFGLGAAVVGTAGAVVLVSLDGFAAKHLAEAFVSAPPETQAAALASFAAEDAINFALLSPLNLVFAGFTFVFYGLAVAVGNVYPRWLGWIAVAGGVGGAVSGVIQAYIGEPSAITTALGVAAPTIITLWLLVIGVMLIRRARAQG